MLTKYNTNQRIMKLYARYTNMVNGMLTHLSMEICNIIKPWQTNKMECYTVIQYQNCVVVYAMLSTNYKHTDKSKVVPRLGIIHHHDYHCNIVHSF